MSKRSNSVDAFVGARIRVRRQSKGLSQEKLGAATGVTFQQQQKRENGVNRVSAGTLFHIAAALQTPISFFFPEGSPAADGEDPVTTALSTKEGADLMVAFSRLTTPEARRHVVNLVASFAQIVEGANGQDHG